MTKTLLLSGNEAIALGAYHAGVKVATAYPGTPSTEILESLACFKDIYAEWSTNEKVAMEVALGAAYVGVRSFVAMKHVGLNVASDPFVAAAITGINAGMVVVTADDPGIHSSQNEQDNRNYARLAKVPMMEPADSQEAYELLAYAFNISEEFDTPVMLRTTTRISHSKSVVNANGKRKIQVGRPRFVYNLGKYVMLPANARLRRPWMEKRLLDLAEYSESFPFNWVIEGKSNIGIITSGIAYQYAREVFPEASFLKLAMTYPLPQKMIHRFAAQVDRLLVIEELEPFIQEHIQAMGIKVTGKEFIPVEGELNPDIITIAGRRAGLLKEKEKEKLKTKVHQLPNRPPLLCPGCPHSGIFYVLSSLGKRSILPGKKKQQPNFVITGDIGCYTLGAYPPLNAMDTCACMGAGIGQALGMEKAGVAESVVAIIGDSTFLHSGITGLLDAVYNDGHITVIIMDNRTTAMTGHQEHPGTGITAQGKETSAVNFELLARGLGIKDVKTIEAWDLKALREGVRGALSRPELSVIIVRGTCSVRVSKHVNPRIIDKELCNQCNLCLMIGCPAIRRECGRIYIDISLCIGDTCALCEQLCPRRAISSQGENSQGGRFEKV